MITVIILYYSKFTDQGDNVIRQKPQWRCNDTQRSTSDPFLQGLDSETGPPAFDDLTAKNELGMYPRINNIPHGY